jgi:hypothetical protein
LDSKQNLSEQKTRLNHRTPMRQDPTPAAGLLSPSTAMATGATAFLSRRAGGPVSPQLPDQLGDRLIASHREQFHDFADMGKKTNGADGVTASP